MLSDDDLAYAAVEALLKQAVQMDWDVDTYLLDEERLGCDIKNMHRGKKNETFQGPKYHRRSAMSKEL